MQKTVTKYLALTILTGMITLPVTVRAAVFHSGTGAVDGFLCVGVECNDYTSASGRTLVLKEDSVQLVFEDDSDAPFPSNDWEITINDSSSSGSNYFQIRDVTGNGNPFRLQAGAPTSSFYLGSNGNVGLGTMLPAGPLHIIRSLDSWIRLETTSSGGYQWDVLGNSTNFIIRDAPNNRLPFRMFPGTANGMLVVEPDGVGIATNDGLGSVDVRAALDVNGDALIREGLEVSGLLSIGTDMPLAPLHVFADGISLPEAQILVENDPGLSVGPRTLLHLKNPGNTKFELENSDAGVSWAFTNSGIDFRISRQGSGVVEFLVDNAGNMEVTGASYAAQHINTSSRRFKNPLGPVDSGSILEKLTQLPISNWVYKATPGMPHIGPMAEDFLAVFGLGDGSTISTVDTAGIAFAAIQELSEQQVKKDEALSEQLAKRDEEFAALRADNEVLRNELESIKSLLAELSDAN